MATRSFSPMSGVQKAALVWAGLIVLFVGAYLLIGPNVP